MVDIQNKIKIESADSKEGPKEEDKSGRQTSQKQATQEKVVIDEAVKKKAGKANSAPVIQPLKDEHMPKDYSISLANYKLGGTDRFLADSGEAPEHSMRGFEPRFRNWIDYIVRITHKIWEEKDIGYIYDTYSHDCSVYDDYGLKYGRDQIVADTLHTTNAFPDIRLVADEIVWAGNDEVGFRSSHRVMILGHNTGYSNYGPPTGKKIKVWCTANCVALDNEIFLEHVLYNNSSMVSQLGFNLKETAIRMAEQKVGMSPADYMASEPSRLKGQAKPTLLTMPNTDGDLDINDFINATYHNLWNRRMLSTIDQAYNKNFSFNGPTDRAFVGTGRYQAFVLSMLAMFPDLAMDIDEVYWMGNAEEGYLTSVRWSASGTHRGNGVYGEPTNREVKIWGITQHKIFDGRIVEEWMLFNELDLLMQLFGSGKTY